MNTYWNDEEEQALDGLPWIAQLTYLRGLRRFMDYDTGIVGLKRGISLKSLEETLHINGGQGRRIYGDASTKAVRHALEMLEKEGLIVKIPAERQLVFRIVLADTNESVSKRWGRAGAEQGQTKLGSQDTSNDGACSKKQGRAGAEPDMPKWGTLRISDNGEEEESANALLSVKPDVSAITAILDHLNARTGSAFRASSGGRPTKAAALIKARLREHSTEVLVAMIDRKHAEWGQDDRMAQYLRPATLFNREKCEQYVGQLAVPQRVGGGKAGNSRAALDAWLSSDEDLDRGKIIDGVFSRAQ